MRISACWAIMLCFFFVFPEAAGADGLRIGLPLPENSREWEIASRAEEKLAGLPAGSVDMELVSLARKGSELALRIKKGMLDGGLVAMGDAGELGLGRDALAYAVPLTFDSGKELDEVREKLDAEILKKLSAGPYEAIGFVEFGFAYVMSSGPLAAQEDWNKRKIWIPERKLPVSLDMLGLETVSLPAADVGKSHERKILDTVIAPPTGAVIKRWHRWIDNVFKVPFFYTYGIFVVKDKSFKRLEAEEQKSVRKHLRRLCRDLSDAIRQRNDKAWKVLDRSGIESVEPNAAMWKQLNLWAEKIRQSMDEHYSPSGDIEEKINKYTGTISAAESN